jgi:TolA-binding protein
MLRKVIIIVAATLGMSGCATTQMQDATAPEGNSIDMVKAADMAYKEGKWKAAEQGYRKVIAKVPADFYAYFRLGNTLAKQLRFHEAAAAYQEALVRDASKTKVYNNLAMIHLFQAESALAAGLKTIPAKDGSAAQIKYMLWQLKKVSRVNLQEVGSPLATK